MPQHTGVIQMVFNLNQVQKCQASGCSPILAKSTNQVAINIISLKLK